MEEGDGTAKQALPVLCQPSTAVEPSDRPFNDPALGQELEAFGGIGSLDDLDLDASTDSPQSVLESRPVMTVMGTYFDQKGWGRTCRLDWGVTVSLLDVCTLDDGMHQQALHVDEDLIFPSLDLFAPVLTARSGRGPAFSALFTLWKSMVAAVGLVPRPACPRHATNRAW